METTLIKTKRCFVCGDEGYLELSKQGVARYERGAFVQDAFPELPAPVREQIITGTHPKCWDEMFGGFDEEEEEV